MAAIASISSQVIDVGRFKGPSALLYCSDSGTSLKEAFDQANAIAQIFSQTYQSDRSSQEVTGPAELTLFVNPLDRQASNTPQSLLKQAGFSRDVAKIIIHQTTTQYIHWGYPVPGRPIQIFANGSGAKIVHSALLMLDDDRRNDTTVYTFNGSPMIPKCFAAKVVNYCYSPNDQKNEDPDYSVENRPASEQLEDPFSLVEASIREIHDNQETSPSKL